MEYKQPRHVLTEVAACFLSACIPALISLYTMHAYGPTEIKHAFLVRMQAPGIVHHGHCILTLRLPD